MNCPSCSFDSPDGFDFCGRCGTALATACGSCGFASPPGFSFCGKCGARLDTAPAPPAPRPPAGSPPASGERRRPVPDTDPGAIRRQVTVMFCDLAGSTQLSERLDPEELREIVRSYQRVAAAAVERHHGHVAQYLGDGILVYFGYPHADEDGARLAVASGLAIVEDMRDLAADFRDLDVELSVRIGLHTGLVVVGEMGGGRRTETLALGSTPNVAARLQGLADHDAVVMSEDTARLVEGLFELESLGRHDLKGVARPVEVLRAVRSTGHLSRFEAHEASGLTPLVGRDAELAKLRAAHERAVAGESQVVLLWGEAGIGKSRLLAALRQAVEDEGTTWATLRCSPDFADSALHPVLDLFARMLRFQRGETPRDRLRKLEALLARSGPGTESWLPLFASLLSLPVEDTAAAAADNPQLRKEKTLEALLGFLDIVAERGPVVLAIENLHWVDPSTHELLDRLVTRPSHARVLVVVSFRPELEPPWHATDRVRHVRLEQLEPDDVEGIIAGVLGGATLPDAIVREIAQRTDGVPLFVEELTRMLVDSGLLTRSGDRYEVADELPAHAIPDTLHDSLAARLDRLGPSLDLVQRCSILGRRFPYELVRAVSLLDEIPLRSRLAHVVGEGVLVENGDPPHAQYYFKHAMMQDAAYESLLKSKRKRLHSRVAGTVRQQFPEIAESSPEIIARHHEAADEPEEAIVFRRKAGLRAADRWAHVETLTHFGRALELLQALPPTGDRNHQELELLSSLGVAHIATKGYGAPEVLETYTRAADLCAEVGDTPFPIRYGLWAFTLLRSDRAAAQEQVRWFRQIADGTEDEDERLMARAVVGTWAFYTGDFAVAETEFERTRELFDPQAHHRVALAHGGCGGLYGHLLTTWLLALTGRLEEARAHDEDVMALAEQLRHPYSLAMALSHAMVTRHDLRDVEGVKRAADRLSQVAADQAFTLASSIALLGEGWVAAEQGRPEDGLPRIEQGLAFFRATGAETLLPYYSSYLAEAHLLAGRPAEARAVLDDGLAMSQRNLDAFYEPELHRLRGDALRAEGRSPSEAEASYREALSLATAQRARLLELRAATSLARHLVRAGRGEQGREALETALGAFAGGVDAPDLRDARAVLAELDGVVTEPGADWPLGGTPRAADEGRPGAS